MNEIRQVETLDRGRDSQGPSARSTVNSRDDTRWHLARSNPPHQGAPPLLWACPWLLTSHPLHWVCPSPATLLRVPGYICLAQGVVLWLHRNRKLRQNSNICALSSRELTTNPSRAFGRNSFRVVTPHEMATRS
ncbi:hypothetical protein JB92DRAFT_1763017 [Gautieria morchelliformis]|nr:hypothetical protein JB92DRAFT_1763017 [Gautieria morchelliformis]